MALPLMEDLAIGWQWSGQGQAKLYVSICYGIQNDVRRLLKYALTLLTWENRIQVIYCGDYYRNLISEQ